jgi:tripartite-type tricarboxylate transporter receptor subunit TctC
MTDRHVSYHPWNSILDDLAMTVTQRIVAGAAVVLAVALANGAAAQKYPEKTVRIVTPFGPGGGTDIFSRILAQHFTETTGRQFIVENRPGAGSTLGTEYVARAPADGYTLLMTSASFSFNPGCIPSCGSTRSRTSRA